MSEISDTIINLVADEANTIRDNMDGIEGFERILAAFPDPARKLKLRKLHAPFSSVGLRLTDAERHMVFSALFDRRIESADDVTNIEVWAFANVMDTRLTWLRIAVQGILHG